MKCPNCDHEPMDEKNIGTKDIIISVEYWCPQCNFREVRDGQGV